MPNRTPRPSVTLQNAVPYLPPGVNLTSTMSEGYEELVRLAHQARREGRPDDAKRLLSSAGELARKADARVDLARALTSLGQIERDLHHNDCGLSNYEEAAAIYRAEGDLLLVAHTIRHLGDMHREQKHAERAEPFYREALALYRANGQTPALDLANAIRGLAILQGEAGETDEAKLLWEEAKNLYAAVDVKAGVDESLRRLSTLHNCGV
jgi:tetratricopeptide (TPR) repeat protein